MLGRQVLSGSEVLQWAQSPVEMDEEMESETGKVKDVKSHQSRRAAVPFSKPIIHVPPPLLCFLAYLFF